MTIAPILLNSIRNVRWNDSNVHIATLIYSINFAGCCLNCLSRWWNSPNSYLREFIGCAEDMRFLFARLIITYLRTLEFKSFSSSELLNLYTSCKLQIVAYSLSNLYHKHTSIGKNSSLLLSLLSSLVLSFIAVSTWTNPYAFLIMASLTESLIFLDILQII